MRIKAKASFAGIGFSASIGSVIDVPDEVAKDLIKAGYAEEDKDPDPAAGKTKRTKNRINKKMIKKKKILLVKKKNLALFMKIIKCLK